MSELNEVFKTVKAEVSQTELGKTAEMLSKSDSELGDSFNEESKLSDEDLNEPIDGIVMPEMKSLDCRSECKYHTGETYKYSNYGFSD